MPTNSWALDGTWGINVGPAWDLCGGADSASNPIVRVGVVDEGIDSTHADLDAETGRNFAAEGYDNNGVPNVPVGPSSTAAHVHDDDRYMLSTPESCERHGTQVAGIVGMLNNLDGSSNQAGGVGVAPEATIVPVKGHFFVWGDDGSGSFECGLKSAQVNSEIADALAWAASPTGGNVRVLVHSWEVNLSSAVTDQYVALRNAGVVSVSSAGHGNSSGVTFPANLPEVIAVGGIDDQGRRLVSGSNGSNWAGQGLSMPFAAPAYFLLTADPSCRRGELDSFPVGQLTCANDLNKGNYVRQALGTSHAAPFVAGTAALMIGVNDALDPHAVEKILCWTSRSLPGWSRNTPPEPPPDCGLIDAGAAVEMALDYLFDDDFETEDVGRWSSVTP